MVELAVDGQLHDVDIERVEAFKHVVQRKPSRRHIQHDLKKEKDSSYRKKDNDSE